ncbi:GATA zinc finger protein 3 [Conoideocrella luteorostrata]|uniref:GATA zinc finger protein 3 n=1 Tax=Conoideocrella luteorostrata TaxID=1105319 RepID=A0AAJ0FSY1_9HYPO|nr:GATA zinc finger protein 3 [Conoideocrella luteorostrata]
MEETQVLPQATTDPISRPSSTSTSASANLQQLPSISAIAASNAALSSPQSRASAAPQNPTYTGATPAGTNGNGNLPTCQNCSTSTTPLWRRDEFGSVLCNACGLFLKLHGRSRPSSLKTDVIKSRNRVKTIRPDLAAKKKQQQQQAQNFGLADINGADLAAQNAAAQAIRRTSQKAVQGNEGSDSPISRTGTPSLYNQGMPSFIVDDPYQSGGYNGTSENGDRDTPQTHEQLIAHNSSLKTRVSELEVINELFRGRLSQLEQQEAAARRGQEVAGVEQSQLREQLEATTESEIQLRAQLDDSHRRENNLKRRLDELELELQAVKDAINGESDRPTKRSRIEDVAFEAVTCPASDERENPTKEPQEVQELQELQEPQEAQGPHDTLLQVEQQENDNENNTPEDKQMEESSVGELAAEQPAAAEEPAVEEQNAEAPES